jgi:hypothetical protein
MARLFVVNCTAQIRQVFYRLDFSVDDKGNRIDGRTQPPKYLEILPGQQVQFGGDLFPTQIEQIVQQLEFGAGAVPMSEIRTAKAKGVVKLVWNQDQPVPRAVCEDVKGHNMGILTDMGTKRRQNLAIVSDYGLREIADQNGNGQSAAFEMEFESVGQEDPGMTAPRLEEGLRVKRGPGGLDAPKRSRSRKAA